MVKSCSIDQLDCLGCEYSKECLCDYPYSINMTFNEIRNLTRELSENAQNN